MARSERSVEAREEADVLRLLTAVNLAAARSGRKADGVAVDGLRDLLDARAVRVVREGPEGELVVAQAGQVDGELDLDDLPHLDEEGRIPSGHRRSVGGTLVSRPRAPWSTWSAATAASAPW